MDWLITKNNRRVSLQNIPELEIEKLIQQIKIEIQSQKRVISFFGVRENHGIKLYVVLADDENSKIYISSCVFSAGGKKSYPSLTPDFPSFHLFEREFFEEFGIIPEGHPWLKPVRYSYNRFDQSQTIENYPFYSIASEEMHQVGVGPVHAGIIEPGHFRFHCFGEKIFHLETQLGYQHRGVEELILKQKNLNSCLIESIAGDSLIAYATTYCNALEALSDTHITRKAMKIRGIGLEMERIAVHLGDLSGISNDIAYLLGNSVFGAIRTVVINSMLELCGSRFGKSLIQLGGVGFNIDRDLGQKLKKNLKKVLKKVHLMEETLFNAPSVISRLEQTGTIQKQDAEKIGMVGPAGRASGVSIDVRVDHSYGIYQYYPVYKFALESGDVFARTYMRFLEIQKSIELIEEIIDYLGEKEALIKDMPGLSSSAMVISMVEGWRGEIVHAALTDSTGKLKKYKIKDPSFNNWYGLTLAVKNNGISDFPLSNKSFNLSYCGFDL